VLEFILFFKCKRPRKRKLDALCIYLLLTIEQVITEVRGIKTVPGVIDYSKISESEEEMSWFKSWCDEVLGNCLRKLIDPTPYRFRSLQLVATEDGNLKSILRRVQSPNLIWLRWNCCPYSCLPPWIPMKNIRVLEVVGSKLKTLWREEFQVRAKPCFVLFLFRCYCCSNLWS